MIRTFTAWLVFVPAAALAQEMLPAPELPRMDATFAIGWLHSDIGSALDGAAPFRDPDWTHDRATFGAGGGIYWTQHIKSELWAERSNTTEVWNTHVIPTPGGDGFRSAEHAVTDARFSFGQFYQFRQNEWVHPSVGAGVTIRRRTAIVEYSPVAVYNGRGGPPTLTVPGERVGPDTRTDATAFVALALKTYVTRRAFLRTDTQVEFGRGVEDVNARIGFGLDF